MRMISLMIAMGVLFLLSPQSAQADWISGGGLGRCGEPCVVSFNYGGPVRPFLMAAKAIKAGAREQVVITSVCSSSCALFADKVRPRVCIMPSAEFVFHKLYRDVERNGKTVRVWGKDPPHSKDIFRWVKANGDFPKADDYAHMLHMEYRDALKFFPRCTAAQLHSKKT